MIITDDRIGLGDRNKLSDHSNKKITAKVRLKFLKTMENIQEEE
jgi:hypothetical protein